MEKRKAIGLRKAKQALSEMSYEQRLHFIAEGLPLFLESAQGCWNASCALVSAQDWGREALMLKTHASEEASKALILMDAVRCPKRMIAARIGKLSGWLYSHLARMIYSDAVHWGTNNVSELRSGVDSLRKSHHPDDMSEEYMVQNEYLLARESLLYVDIERNSDGKFTWSDPSHIGHVHMLLSRFFDKPGSLQLIEAMSAIGVFTLPGIKAVSEIWGTKSFTSSESRRDNRELIGQLIFRLDDEELDNEELEQVPMVSNPDDVLYLLWQLPMYDLNLSKDEVH